MSATQQTSISRPFFVREATGLVRELSWFDTFLCGFGILNVALGLVQAFAYAPYVFPGSNMALAFVIALPGAFFIGLLNALFTAAMPRSGGDYVWVSRSISPVVGFAVNFFATFGVCAAAAVNIWYLASNFLAPALYVFGFQQAAAWVATPQAALILGIPAIILLVFIFSLGLNVVRRVMLVLFLITGVGTLIWLLMMIFGNNAGFVAGFNALMGENAYQSLIQTANAAGRTVDPAQSGRNSFYAMIYAFQMYGGFQMIGYFAGEIKRVSRSAMQAIMTALAIGALFFIFGSLIVVRYFGYDFLGSVAYLANEAPDQFNLPLGPYISSFIIFMTTNPLLRIIVLLGNHYLDSVATDVDHHTQYVRLVVRPPDTELGGSGQRTHTLTSQCYYYCWYLDLHNVADHLANPILGIPCQSSRRWSSSGDDSCHFSDHLSLPTQGYL